MKTKIKNTIEGKIILITGGTGSFGNSVIEKLLSFSPKQVVIFSRDELKQYDMRNKYDDPRLKFIIGDVREPESVDRVTERVDYIFHAAALKQVPACEFFPIEAVKTNILGTANVINAAIKHKVKRLIVLSTDKAVYPINAMGMTKALMEKTMIASSKVIMSTENKHTVLTGVRYGNVMYSRGSVIPYFLSLIKQGKPLSITDLHMTRFLLPLKNAVDLVLFAMTDGDNGCMYVRKSPACTVEIIAKAMCKVFDYKKGYIEVGMRAGEKMYETLLTSEELIRAVDVGEYYKIPAESQGLDYNKYLFKGGKTKNDPLTVGAYTSKNTTQLDVDKTTALLLTLPEIEEELRNYKRER